MKQHSILIVDKEPKNLNILENNFREADFEVDKATSDYEALKYISSKHYDVILSEVTGPSIDGYHILEQLQRDSTKADIPVVFLTQKSDIWNRVKSFKLGAKDYIVKPMHVKEIVGRINMLLKRLEKQRSEELLAKRKFTGRIEDFKLADLIETFGVERKTGILTLVNQNGTAGQVYFSEGKIIGAETKGMQDESAIYKMMSWNKGRFSMLFTKVDEQDSCKISNLGLLLEGAKRMEQRDELLKHIPSLEAVVVTTSNFRKILEQKALSQDLKQFLDLFDGERTISRIIDESPEDELTILSRIAKLSNLGFLHVLRDFSTEQQTKEREGLEPINSEELARETRAIFSEEPEPFETESETELDEEEIEISGTEETEQWDEVEFPADDAFVIDEPTFDSVRDFGGDRETDLDSDTVQDFDTAWEDKGSAASTDELSHLPADNLEDTASLEILSDEPELEKPLIEEEPGIEETAVSKPVEPFADWEVTETAPEPEKTTEPFGHIEELEVTAETKKPLEPVHDGGEPEKSEEEKPAVEEFVSDNGVDNFVQRKTHFDLQTDPFAGFGERFEQMESEAEPLAHEELPTMEEHPADKLLRIDEEQGFETAEPEKEVIAAEPEPGEKVVATSVAKTIAKPDAEEIKRRYNLAKGCILVLGTDEVHRKTFIDSLAKEYTNTADTGIENVSPVYYGTAQFKGDHYLNLISFSIKNEFTPLVEYFASKTLAYIVIVDEEQPDWPYLNYLVTVLRNNLHKPAKVIFTSKKYTEAEIRSKLVLKAGESVTFCDRFEERETKKLIFSLFVK